MEKFSDVEHNFKPKKYLEPLKETIYNIVNDNIKLQVQGDQDVNYSVVGQEAITEQLYELLTSEVLKERLNILTEVKGVSNLGGINIKNIDKEIEKIVESLKK